MEMPGFRKDALRSCAASKNAMNNKISPYKTGIVLIWQLADETDGLDKRSPRKAKIQLEIIMRSGTEGHV